jgi:O-antigen/teichoic acid export membrane protein
MSAVAGYLVLADLGVPSALNRLLPILRGAKEDRDREHIVKAAIAFLSTSTAVVAVLIVTLGKLIFRDLSLTELFAYSAYIVSTRINQYTLIGLRTSNQFGLVSRNQMAQCIVLILISFPLIRLWGLVGFMTAFSISIVVSTLVTKSGWTLQRPSGDLTIVWRLVKEGMPIYINGYIFGIFATLDRWFIAKFLGRRALGQYWLALVAASAVITIQNIIASQCYPRMANEWGRLKDGGSAERWVRGEMLVSITASAGMLALMLLLLPVICSHWLPQYREGVLPAIILMAAACALPLGGTYSTYLLVTGRQWFYLKLQLLPLALSCVLWMLIAAPGMQLSGAACITGAAYLIYSGTLFYWGRAVCRSDRAQLSARLRPPNDGSIAKWN